MNIIKRILVGIVIGGGMILPGVSGGVLAVVFGIYEDMLEAVAKFFKNVKKNSVFLGPLLLGVAIGVLLFGKILFFVFDEYPTEAKFAFIGLILGGLPVLLNEIKSKGEKKLKLIPYLISFTIAIVLFVLGRDTINIDFSSNLDNGIISFVLLFMTGFIFIAGKIIPGISSSFMLMLIGMYQFLLNILNNPLGLSSNEYFQLLPFCIGIAVGGVSLIKIIRYLIKNYFSLTYSAIFGFVIGSIAAIYPGFSFNLQGLICLLLLITSFFISYKFTLKGQNKPKHK